jgi:hypothetical protein
VKPSRSQGPQRIYRWTLLVWGVLVVIHLSWYLVRVFQAPPSTEIYANRLEFQVIAFGLTQFPYWLLALIFLLLLEFLIFGRARSGSG